MALCYAQRGTLSIAAPLVICGFVLTAGALACWLLMNDTVSSPEEA